MDDSPTGSQHLQPSHSALSGAGSAESQQSENQLRPDEQGAAARSGTSRSATIAMLQCSIALTCF